MNDIKKKITTYFNLNQEFLIQNSLCLEDGFILEYLKQFSSAKGIVRKVIDGVEYFWLAYSKAISDLPILKINNKQVMARKLKGLVNNGFLKSFLDVKNGNKTYFSLNSELLEGVGLTVDRVLTEKYNNSLITNTLENSLSCEVEDFEKINKKYFDNYDYMSDEIALEIATKKGLIDNLKAIYERFANIYKADIKKMKEKLIDWKLYFHNWLKKEFVETAKKPLKPKQLPKSRSKNEFYKWLRALSIEPVIKGIRLDVNESINKELSRAIEKGFVPKEYEDNMKKMAQQMFNHFLHLPTQKLRAHSKEKDSVCSIDAIANMFNISRDEKNPQQYKTDHHKKGYKI